MELRHLRYFAAVADSNGFGRAARLLNVSQSAISEQIGDLEDELKVLLFNRQNRRIELTAPGEQFLRDAKAILADADKAIGNAQKAMRGEIGSLRIGFFVGGTGTFFPTIIKEYRRRFEHVHISLVEMAPGNQHQALMAGTIDLGFTRALQPAQAAALRSEYLMTEPIFAVFPTRHALAKKRSVSMRELSNEMFVLNDRRHSPAVFDKVISLCAEAGFSPRIGSTATVSSGVIALVEAGEGIAILPQGARSLQQGSLVFVPLSDPGASVDLVIAWSLQHRTPAVDAFVLMVRQLRSNLPKQAGSGLAKPPL